MCIVGLSRCKSVIDSGRKNEEISLLQSTSNPAFILITNLIISPTVSREEKADSYIEVPFSTEDIADFFIGVEMFFVEVLDHGRILIAELVR